MPYVMRTRGKKFEVVNPLTNSVKGTHKTKRQALAQMRALYANVPDALEKRKGNIPTNPQLWMQAKNQAKQRFAVYPSAYANAWASRWYKEHGGAWKEAPDNDGLQKVVKGGKQVVRQEWVDIKRPIRDRANTIIGYQPCDPDSNSPTCFPRQQALMLLESERTELINKTSNANRVTKYGTYKRKRNK